ncbi:dihydroorotate dehydrogenase electron transfer subunit [Candidatus Micrarchaeota archaeon]|nr:dihydroorotate dehydrogenase electron transfer subunit [Candidatus Micrarchaeota archaeon]
MLPKEHTIVSVDEENPQTKTIYVGCEDMPKPGQFYMVWLPGVEQKPFSVAGVAPLRFSVCAVGPFSSKFASMKKGGKVWLCGPYGNSFSLHGKKIVAIGGGYGAGPMRYLSLLAKKQGVEPVLIIGARSKDRLMKGENGMRTVFATDDGSQGIKGNAVDALKGVLKEGKVDVVYACGPEKMMGAVGKLCIEKGIKCQLLLERYMKCGFGMCGQCSIGEKLVCFDGPVFGAEIVEDVEFGKFHRDCAGRKKIL